MIFIFWTMNVMFWSCRWAQSIQFVFGFHVFTAWQPELSTSTAIYHKKFVKFTQLLLAIFSFLFASFARINLVAWKTQIVCPHSISPSFTSISVCLSLHFVRPFICFAFNFLLLHTKQMLTLHSICPLVLRSGQLHSYQPLFWMHFKKWLIWPPAIEVTVLFCLHLTHLENDLQSEHLISFCYFVRMHRGHQRHRIRVDPSLSSPKVGHHSFENVCQLNHGLFGVASSRSIGRVEKNDKSAG